MFAKRFLTRGTLFLGVATSCCLSLPAHAGHGKVAGRVVDEAGEALVGAAISCEVAGRNLGTVTDEEGRYFILGMPPGSFAVQASYVGHQAVRQTDVVVRLDLTTELDFELATVALPGQVLTVTAERPAIERTLTSTRQHIAAAELNNTMPVSDLQDLIDTTPSSFRGFIRGGRKSDSKLLIDGIDVSDTYFRSGEGSGVFSPYTAATRSTAGEFSSVGINASSIQSVDLISGTFNAEYDAASAGVINVVAKEGGESFAGRLFIRTSPGTKNAGPDVYNDLDSYLAARDALLTSTHEDGSANEENREKGALYGFDRSTIDAVGYGDDIRTETELSLGGPLGARSRYQFTGRFLNDHGHFANSLNRSARYSLKLTHRPSDAVKLTGNLMIDDAGKLGGWVNRDFNGRFKFYPQGAIGNKKLGAMAYAGLTHVLSPQTYYELKISQLNRASEFGFSDDNGDGRVDLGENGDFITIDNAAESEKYLGVGGSAVDPDGNFTYFTSDPGNEKFFRLPNSDAQYRVGQPGFYYEEIKRNVTQLKADITHQLNYHHQLKGGLLYRYHALDQFQQRTQVRVIFDPKFPFETTKYALNPTEFALYAQDKIEFEGVIVNAGLRLDAFDPGAQKLADFFVPSHQDTLASGQIVRVANLGEDAAVKWFWQPRLGISHPITDTAALHYSWGLFYSPQAFSWLFDEYGTFANPSLPNVRDVDAKPPTSTAYEMGLQWGLHPDYKLDVTAYYRDIDNYGTTSYAINPDPEAAVGFGSYSFITSFGYADSRGIEVSLLKRPAGRISGRASYSFSYIKAAGGAGDTTPFPDKRSYAYAAGDREIPLDDRTAFNTIERNVNGGNNALTSGYDRTHQLSISLLARLGMAFDLAAVSTWDSGFQYQLVETSNDPRERQTRRAPVNFTTAVRLTRGFEFGGLGTGVFLEVANLFDRENIIAFDNYDVDSQKLWEEKEDPTGALNRAFSSSNQPLYDPPRQISMGVSVDF